MIIDIFTTFGWSAVAVLVFVLIVYLKSLAIRRLDIADVAWGIGFVVIAIVSLIVGQGTGGRPLLVAALVTIWGVRLAVHILLRHRGRPEDKRYVTMQATWKGNPAWQAVTRIFLSQGLLMLAISIPVIINGATSRSGLSLLDYVGVTVWLVGFLFESIGDVQLSRFIANPVNRGKLLTTGLWRYTRHPNYFGEVTEWWGIFLLVLSVPYGAISLIGPLTISFLILKVSGIPLLEKAKAGQPQWEAYKARTNKFFPWLPHTAQ